MRKFSFAEFQRSPGALVEAAHRGPVELTGRGKRKFILLAAEDYDRIVSQPRRAYHVGGMTEG
jgi:antitoxin Phd